MSAAVHDLPLKVRRFVERPSRLAAVHAAEITEYFAKEAFQSIVKAAAVAVKATQAIVGLVDKNEEILTAAVGTEMNSVPIQISFCPHAIAGDEDIFIVNDMHQDNRFRENPLVSGPPHLRFCAIAPIYASGEKIGALSMFATEPRDGLTVEQHEILSSLAKAVSALFDQPVTESAAQAQLLRLIEREKSRSAEAIETKRALLLEVDHRVRNTLASLSSLSRHTLRRHQDPQAFAKSFNGRLASISRTHTQLSKSAWTEISLLDAIDQQVSVLRSSDQKQAELVGDDIMLLPDQALGLSFMMHELATNAVSHGAWSVPGGIVKIDWTTSGPDDQKLLNLNWEERDAPPRSGEENEGFGLILIKRSLDKILGSSVEFEFGETGMWARIEMPLN